ncbi:MAG: LysR family transcriptional regulator [Oligoflexia bacterium]|nr:LysR family transcriptional regulator [Oligoflexia bacterium]
MNPWINYHHLFYFKTIAEEGTVLKAAEKLRLGQPTLSAQLKQFEDTIGIKLFDRYHKKLVLTEQGKVALDYAKNIFKMGNEMFEVLHDRLVPYKPTVHLGAIDSISKHIILQLVKSAFKFSRCQITLSEGKPDELLRELSAHKIDLVLTNFLPIGTSAKGIFPRKISKKHVSFYAATKFKKLRTGFPKSMSGQPLIIPTYDSKLRYDLDHWAKLHDIELNIIAEGQDISVEKLMAVSALGIIPAAAHTVTKEILAGELIEIGPLQGVYEEIYLLSMQRKIPNPIAIKLMESFNI